MVRLLGYYSLRSLPAFTSSGACVNENLLFLSPLFRRHWQNHELTYFLIQGNAIVISNPAVFSRRHPLYS